jgi:predicted permease
VRLPFWRNEQRQAQLEQEIKSHLQMAASDRVERGESPQHAQQAARREFGNVALVEQVTRDQWATLWLDEFLQDLRYAARMLRRNPSFPLIAVLTLALGIGANTAIFSLVNSILLRPLPYHQPEQLVQVTGTYPKGGIAAMRSQMQSMDVAAYMEGHEVNLTGRGAPVRLTATLVSAELFSVLGTPAELGRTLHSGEDLAAQNSYVILSHRIWQQRFAADPSVIGQWIKLEGLQRQIIGVMPPDFRFPSPQTDVWIPLDIDPRNTISYWAGDFLQVIGRLRPGATLAQASNEIRMFQSHVMTLFPWTMPATWNAGVAVVSLRDGLVGDIRARLLILLVAVALVLLIACANVANLALSRATVRGKEIALRVSLGAGRSRIFRQLITESVLMSAVGGALGLALAAAGLSLLKSSLPVDTPRRADVALDWQVLLFTAVLAIVTGIVSGTVPALHASRPELTEALKAGSRGTTHSASQRLRHALVIGELGLAVLLVCGAGLLIKSLWALSHVNPGFRSENVLTARVTPNQSLCDEPARCVSFYRDLLHQLRSLPGVTNAALINTLPLGGRVQKRSVNIENYVAGSSGPEPLLWMDAVSPGYFQAMGIPLLRGHEFAESDTSGDSHVAIISAETARRFFPNQDALGRHIRLLRQKDWCTIIGIAADVRAYDLQRNVPAWMEGTFYVPYGPLATLEDGPVPAEMTLIVRSAESQRGLQESLRKLASSLSEDVPIAEVKPMTLIIANVMSAPRAVTSLFSAFAALALVLGIVGIYGVISFFVSQRTREIGVRMALGAQPRDVLKLVIREGLSLTLIGVALGLIAALALTRFLGSLLYGVGATDPLSFAGVAVLFAIVALAACYIPARRAMRVDPLIALRYE